MESPPSFSTHSEVPPLSEDSGLFITSGSLSSDSASGWHLVTSELQESDCDEHSLSFGESAETPERMCGANFNTVKKGPAKSVVTTIEPPPEFQDRPVPLLSLNKSASIDGPDDTYESVFNAGPRVLAVPMSGRHVPPLYPRQLKAESLYERRQALNRYASPRLLHLSPCRPRPSSRASLCSRLSSSHNSLASQPQPDDSNFITQAISHDALSHSADITDMYNVPFDSDIYAVPIDMVRPTLANLRHKGKQQRSVKKRKSTSHPTGMNHQTDRNHKSKEVTSARQKEAKPKRHSLQSCSSKKNVTESDSDSLHMTLREMRKYLHTLYSSSSDSERNTVSRKNNTNKQELTKQTKDLNGNGKVISKEATESNNITETNNKTKKSSKHPLVISKSKKHKDLAADLIESEKTDRSKSSGSSQKSKVSPVRILSINLKQSFCNLFRWRRQASVEEVASERTCAAGALGVGVAAGVGGAVVRRALPPLPQPPPPAARRAADEEPVTDFATSIQKVKDYPWYWGPVSVEAAEKILSNEPDGSFIVRDSSDDHYIFTLTFKLNGLRHVRIEHDQGNFCFGGCTMFKAQTIVEFIENAVETSRSGRYLFFLNLRPVLGPVRVQLLYPVSRFKRVQSLQHMCRFVILKYVRRDLVSSLPLPRRLVDYLSATHYYSELLADL